MLGREAVVDREDMHVGVAADAPAQVVMGVEVAGDEAAAMEVDEQGPRLPGSRRIVARADHASAALDGEVGDRADRDRRGRQSPALPGAIPAALRGQPVDRARRPQGGAQGEHELHLRMQRRPLDRHRRRGPTGAAARRPAAQTSSAPPGIRDAGARSDGCRRRGDGCIAGMPCWSAVVRRQLPCILRGDLDAHS